MSALRPEEVAANWKARTAAAGERYQDAERAARASARPMSEAQIEKVLADYRDQYVLGWFDLEQLERHVELALRAYYSSRPG